MKPQRSDTETRKIVKIPYDSLTLRAVVAELRAHLLGGQVQDIRQPEPLELQLGIRSQNRNFLLLLSADAQFARAHLTRARRPNAPTPPTFCMTLRKHIENAVITDIRQRGFDRILEIVLGRHEDEEPRFILIAELMGKHSNVILVNAEGTILDSMKRVSHRINRVRETLPGLPYQSPPEQSDRVSPFEPDALAFLEKELGGQTAPEVLSETLLNLFAGISPFLARDLALRAQGDDLRAVWKQVIHAAQEDRYAPVLARDADNGHALGAYPFAVAQEVGTQRPTDDLNAALDLVFTGQIERARFAALSGELRGKLDAESKRLQKQQASLARTLAESGRAEEYKQTGELILANIWKIEEGAAAVTVQDYYQPDFSERTLELDPTLTPQENAEAHFRRYRKAKDSEAMARQQQEELDSRLYRVLEAQDELAAASNEAELTALREKVTQSRLLRNFGEEKPDDKRRATPDFEGHKIRRFTTPDGYEILVGESATANDFLTTRVASPNDWWLHVRAAVSSHVVIRTHGQPAQVPRSVLLQAAKLCAQHSQQKHSSLVSVDYTLKKFVRKPRGAAPGAADYTQEQTIDVSA